MKVLVFGNSGQVAQALQRHDGVIAMGRPQADLMQPEHCAELIAEADIEAVINAAAYTAVDAAEDHPDAAMMVNATAPGVMARAAAKRDIPFVHLSTDCVFDGSGNQPWQPDAPAKPLGVYGHSKRAGELAVQAAGGPYVVLRTSWVFSTVGSNFVHVMLRLSKSGAPLRVVDDQFGGPTAATDIASACLRIADVLRDAPQLGGTYHIAGTPFVSRAEFAREIFEITNRDVEITPIPTSAYPTPAERPLNARLDSSSLRDFGIKPPEWRGALAKVLQELERNT